MTSPTVDLDDEPAGGQEDLRATVEALEWIRRRLAAIDHPAATTLGRVLIEAGRRPGCTAVLSHPWTARWVEVALRLIDRNAHVLLPAGQVAAHLGRAANLEAALLAGAEPVAVRLDAAGIGWLPGTGMAVVADPASAGLVVRLEPVAGPNARTGVGASSPLGSSVTIDDPAARLVDERQLDEAAREHGQEVLAPDGSPVVDGADGESSSTEPGSVADGAPMPVTPSSLELIGRWPRALADRSTGHRARAVGPAPHLAARLEEHGIPVDPRPNPLSGRQIRLDSTFDHLSLLSVRSPVAFAELAAAADGSDACSLRVRGHVAYIERRHLEAAAIYAELLAEQPSDADLWRDACWALRHAGHEEIVRTWVLRPVEVIQVATAVAWQPDQVDDAGPDPLDRLLDYLDWISHALGAR